MGVPFFPFLTVVHTGAHKVAQPRGGSRAFAYTLLLEVYYYNSAQATPAKDDSFELTIKHSCGPSCCSYMFSKIAHSYSKHNRDSN
jgi:hypothetical protein